MTKSDSSPTAGDPHWTLRTPRERELILSLTAPQLNAVLALEQHVRQDPSLCIYSSVHIRGKLPSDGDGAMVSTRHIRTHMLEDHYLWCDVFTYRRFLHSRQWDLVEAWKYVQRWAAWRLEKKPHLTRSLSVEKEIRMEKAYWFTGSRMDAPTIVVNLHNHIVSERSVEGSLQYVMFMAEQGISLMRREYPENVGQYCILYDASRFSMSRNLDLLMVREFLTIANMYPETMKRVYICRPGFIFKKALQLMKAMMDKGTTSKFVLINDFDELLDYYDKSQLPKEFGGESTVQFDAEAMVAAGRADRKPEEGESRGADAHATATTATTLEETTLTTMADSGNDTKATAIS